MVRPRSHIGEPAPVWPDAPRYCPDRALPPYRFVPGVNPHPTEDPAGHSFGKAHTAALLPAARWRENGDYLFGIDLYHRGYLWESHEAWEGLWSAAGRQTLIGRYLQALIFNSAGLLKLHQRQERGGATHGLRCATRIQRIEQQGITQFMGIDLPRLRLAVETYYNHVQTPGDKAALRVAPPRLELDFRPDESAT